MSKYIEDDTLVAVRNRNNGWTGYQIPELHIKREFTPDQTKMVPFRELSELLYTEGGEYLLKHLLVVEDKNALLELGLETEPEYQYTRDQIRNVMFNGTLDEFTDFVNFAPDGALEIAKEMAVKEFLPDSNKRKILGKKLDFNIDKAIEIENIINVDEDSKKKDQQLLDKVGEKTRRAAVPTTEAEKPARKVIIPTQKN